MKKISLLSNITLLTVSLMFGCNTKEEHTSFKEENEQENNETTVDKENKGSSKKLLPSKIIASFGSLFSSYVSSSIHEFEYDDQNRIINIVTIEDSIIKKIVKLSYKNNDIYTEETYLDNPENKIVKEYHHDDLQILIDGEKPIKIDDNFQVTHIEQEKYGPCNFTYDEAGNAISYSYHAWNDERVLTINFTYNDDNGIFRHVNTPSWFLITQISYDVISETNKIFYQCLYNNCATTIDDYITINKYKYTYNTDNFPTMIDEVPVSDLSNSSLSFKIEYSEAN